jgi:pimeloyl-ACP methyl ester carboxylesterase
MMRRAAMFFVVGALVAAACNETPQDTSRPSPTPYRTPSSVAWTDCGGGFACTTVTVPLDYTNPNAGTIKIALIEKHAIDSSHRIGSLLVQPGGPGISGVDSLRNYLATPLARLNQRFDLVSFDPRGVGRSAPVRCLNSAERDAGSQLDAVLDDPQERQVYLQALRSFASACQDNSGWLLPFVGTGSVARDMDVIRIALGEDRLNYLGFSYGTYVGEVYAHLFPTHVRALALDGVVDPGVAGPDLMVRTAAGIEANLQAFFTYCTGRFSCFFGSTRDPAGRLDALLNRLDKSPLSVGRRKLSRGQAMTAILSLLVFPTAWDLLSTALAAADEGDGLSLLITADAALGRHADGSYAIGSEAMPAINCLDDRPAVADVATYDRLGPALIGASPLFGPWLQFGPVICSYWSVQPKPVASITTQGAPPILLVGATEDPYAPLAYAQNVSRQMPGSVVLARNGFGHPSFDKSFCVQDAVNAYLIDLTLPAPGTVCESSPPNP